MGSGDTIMADVQTSLKEFLNTSSRSVHFIDAFFQ